MPWRTSAWNWPKSFAAGLPIWTHKDPVSADQPGSVRQEIRETYLATGMLNSANVPRSHFHERSIIGLPWPSHSMLNAPS